MLHRTRSCLNMHVCQNPGAVSMVEITTTAHGACPCLYICMDIGVAQVFCRTWSCPCTSSIQYSYNWTHRRISGVADVLDTSQTMGTSSRPLPNLFVMLVGPLLIFSTPALILCQMGSNPPTKIQKFTNVAAPFLRSPLIDCIYTIV